MLAAAPPPAARPAETASPEISAVVPAHNAAATLDGCLAALAASAGCAAEIVVVDDGSLDATPAIAQAWGVRLVRLPRRRGAAAARNAGACVARAPVLFFTDADVLVQSDTLARALGYLRARPGVSAVFGSYQAETVHRNFCSVYKNLVHHLTHQAARTDAHTFWAGAGAVRADAFWAAGGFDPGDTRGADVEDIALGYRLTAAGYRIHVDHRLQVTHAKRYTLGSLIRSDVLHRAMPWTRLMLRERRFQNDLNTGGGSLASAAAVFALLPALRLAIRHPALVVLPAALLAAFLVLNQRLFGRCAARGPDFLLRAIAMTALYYLYAAAGAVAGTLLHLRDRTRPARRVRAAPSRLAVGPGEVIRG